MSIQAALPPKPTGVRNIQTSFDGPAAVPARRKIGLDAARAAAIGLVLVCHFDKSLDFLGVPGVELFFALSGFLIGSILYRALAATPRWSLEEVRVFWLRRWWRTLPNYYLFLAIHVVFHAWVGGWPGFGAFVPFLVFCQDLLSADSWFFSVSWSLCVEEWFYLLFPVGILLFTTLRCSKRTAFLGTTAFFLLVPPLVRERMFATHDPETVHLMTLARLDAIFYGVATAFCTARFRPGAAARLYLLVAAGLGLLALGGYQYHCLRHDAFVPFYRTALVGLPLFFSLALPFLAAVETLPAPLEAFAGPITKLSLWSYSIYLSHIPILFLTYAAFGTWRNHPTVNVLSKLVGVAVSVGVSRLVYERFETPLLRLRPAETTSHA